MAARAAALGRLGTCLSGQNCQGCASAVQRADALLVQPAAFPLPAEYAEAASLLDPWLQRLAWCSLFWDVKPTALGKRALLLWGDMPRHGLPEYNTGR